MLFFLGLLLPGAWKTPLAALEFEITGGVNNMTYHPDRVTAHRQSTNYTQFKEYPFGFGDFILRDELSSKMGYRIQASRDNILRNSLSGLITTDADYLNVEFGPFISINDDFEKPDFGFAGRLEVGYPGVIFLAISGSSSIGSQYEFMSQNKRETAEVRLSFWSEHLIPSFSANTKIYTRNPETFFFLRDELFRLQFSTEVYAKTSPVTLRFDAGWQTLSRSYKRGVTEIVDELSSVFIGVEAKWQVSKPWRLIAGFEIPLYFEAVEPMKSPSGLMNISKFYGGIAYTHFK